MSQQDAAAVAVEVLQATSYCGAIARAREMS